MVLARAAGGRKHPHVKIEDLTDTTRLLTLHGQFLRAGIIGGGQDDILWFVGAAEHALRVGGNPCALFVATVRKREQRSLWVTQADEDRARARIKQFETG